MLLRRLCALAAAALLAGCGGGAPAAPDGGTATLWVTRDRGAEVLLEAEVAAGQTVLEALRGEADVETRYGGRFVQAIDGLEGSLEEGRDWLYFVNGLAADRSAAEYRLRPGEIAWWDYFQWTGREEVRVVVGAFPEPFLHGYDGKVRPAAVTYELPEQEEAARRLAEVIGADTVTRGGPAPDGANVLALVSGAPRFIAETRGPDGPVRFTFAGDADALAADPTRFRFRFEVRG